MCLGKYILNKPPVRQQLLNELNCAVLQQRTFIFIDTAVVPPGLKIRDGHHERCGILGGQSYWDRFLSQQFGLSVSLSFHQSPVLIFHSFHRRYIILGIEGIVK